MSFWKSIFAPARDDSPVQPPRYRHYSVPDGCIIYAIGDIHGRFDLLVPLLGRIREHRAQHAGQTKGYVVFLGDYVDRGFQSREVLDFLCKLTPEAGLEYVFLAGNHEDLMLGFIDDPFENLLWLKVGGLQTLASYGVPLPQGEEKMDFLSISNSLSDALPAHHKDFLCALRTWWRAGNYLFVHAGIRPGCPLEKQKRRDLLGIRQTFTESLTDFGLRVVHGHTGVPNVTFYGNRVAVDTGAFATGKLSAAVFWDDQQFCLATDS